MENLWLTIHSPSSSSIIGINPQPNPRYKQTDVFQVHRVLAQHIQMHIDSVLSLCGCLGVWVTLRGRVSYYLAVCLQVLAS